MSKINSYKAIVKRDAVAEAAYDSNFSIEKSFYQLNATWHDMIFFHASASGMAAVLLILVIKGRVLFPGTVSLLGAVSPIAIFIISMILLFLAFYFFAISILKLGTILSTFKIKGKEVKTLYAIAGVYGYFLVFAIIALILV